MFDNFGKIKYTDGHTEATSPLCEQIFLSRVFNVLKIYQITG
jgi:hypothetical protein